TGRDIAELQFEENFAWRLVWSPDGAFLVSSHPGNVFRFWDTRQLTGKPYEMVALPAAGPLPRELGLLLEAFAGIYRLGLHPPLSLLKDLLDLMEKDWGKGALAILSTHSGVRALAELNWPAAARVGLVALLLRGVPLEDWSPPV